jgi:hypothetical protein
MAPTQRVHLGATKPKPAFLSDSLSGGHEKKSVTVRHNWASFMAIRFRVLRPRGFFRHKSPLTGRGGGLGTPAKIYKRGKNGNRL